uniref:eRF1/Pelota-like N-terminal domain-containing protein n=1 Tax=Cryptomonas curvata TaxID=233186 RepID=A0A7S0MXL9_9CRYP|nr:eukaryotic release factor 1 [Cryptomonas curvata]|mmetsp:Transcript_56926/g.119022  ORF Transcript_56926/g.119022 Transcript_56926/m.119022 type:complete len:431 (+) Transcript_56926:146-1438(+)
MSDEQKEEDLEIEKWKTKKLLKFLNEARGNGTSMISLIIPPGDQVSRVSKMLSDELATASNIKSRVNRLSVLSAIISTQQRLKLYNKTPENGLILYCGTIIDAFNKEKKVTFDIEPIKAINTSLYLCDNKFHTDILYSLLENEEKIGFIIIDGKGVLFGTLRGTRKEILYKLAVDLPKKHGRGGQSALRFARMRMEKRYNFLKKVVELSNQYFINEQGKINVIGLILAGSADFKNELSGLEIFDLRLQSKIIQVLDIAYGGESGFNQAIDACSGVLANSKFIKEKKIVTSFFEEIAKNSGKYVFGFDDTLKNLEAGIIDKLLCWENLKKVRVVFYNTKTKIKNTEFLDEKELSSITNGKNFKIKNELEIIEKELFLDWVVNNRKSFGLNVCLISDCTPEGDQFIKGFGGIGGILRYEINDSHTLINSDDS